MYVLKQAVNMKLSFNFFTSRESPKSHSLYFESLYKMDKFLGHTIGMKKYVYIHNFVMQGLVFIAHQTRLLGHAVQINISFQRLSEAYLSVPGICKQYFLSTQRSSFLDLVIFELIQCFLSLADNCYEIQFQSKKKIDGKIKYHATDGCATNNEGYCTLKL